MQQDKERNDRLPYLDGVRGLAAAFVVLHHIKGEAEIGHVQPGWFDRAFPWLNYGHFAVGAFIVLSGFCLMLPMARRDTGTLAGGTGQYLVRRARRICPPFYAALVIYLGLLCIPGLRQFVAGTAWGTEAEHSLTVGSITSHLLLAHNFSMAWAHRIDPPMWSVAPEWDFYFLLPLVLLPTFRRFGTWGMVVIGLVLGFVVRGVRPALFDSLATWYFALFAMGCAAAVVSFSAKHQRLRERVPWGALLAAAVVLPIVALPRITHGGYQHQYLGDLVAGPCIALLLTYLAVRRTRRGVLAAALEHPVVLWLGAISYSLYLIHYPIVSLVAAACRGMRPAVAFGCLFVIVPPVSLGVAYLFHRVFERPFMGGRRVRERQPDAGAGVVAGDVAGSPPELVAVGRV